MRIAIVNNELASIEAITKVLEINHLYSVAWVAYDGIEATIKYNNDKPDLILMYINNMPVMNGVEATRKIMKEHPCPILLVASSISHQTALIYEALGYGALDVVNSPIIDKNGVLIGADAILKKISTITKLIGYEETNKLINENNIKIEKRKKIKLIAIGSSTGGPGALSEILTHLPVNFNASIVIVQHVDPQFVEGLAKWLGQTSKLDVRLAIKDDCPVINVVYVASSNDHLIINKNSRFDYVIEPVNYPYRPSVNEFFKSLAFNWKKKELAILLTGMGNDGAAGLLTLKKSGWKTIAQDEKTSIVYGMPKAAFEMGAADEILPINKIASSILSFIND